MKCVTPVFIIYMLGGLFGCSNGSDQQSGTVPTRSYADGPLDIVIDVPTAGPYGSRTVRVPAQTNWVNSGLYLRSGESVTFNASGNWLVDQQSVGPEGNASLLGEQRGCAVGSLVARSGLHFEDALSCIGVAGSFTASKDDIVYLGMVSSTDLGEAYGERLQLSGELTVEVISDGDTVPTVRTSSIAEYDFSSVASGWVELVGEHIIIPASVSTINRDIDTAVDSLNLLDQIYKIERTMRGMAPFNDQRIRFALDDLGGFYMLAGNPIRVNREILDGASSIRILRASESTTDIWGFAHELGHVFSFANATWVYQTNLESWPNIFTIDALTQLERTANQPNIDTYCSGRDAYLENGQPMEFADDPFLQLCFFMEFTNQYGWGFWTSFFAEMNQTTNSDVGFDGTDVSAWRFIRDRFSQAAGEDVTGRFNQWRVPLE